MLTNNYKKDYIEGIMSYSINLIVGLVIVIITLPFKVRPLVLSKTLSQMWDRINLPISLFKVGLLTLM